MKDLTATQFNNAIARNGIVNERFLGYYKFTATGVSVSIMNYRGTKSFRGILAWLLAEKERVEQKVISIGQERA